jgi:hypothetical protein
VVLFPEGAKPEVGEALRSHGFLVLQPGDPGIALPVDDLEAADLLYRRFRKEDS